MATSRKQITTYLPTDLVQALEEWQRMQGIGSVSAAVVAILQEYLQGRSAPMGMPQAVEDLVEIRISGVREEVEQLRQQVEALIYALAQTGVIDLAPTSPETLQDPSFADPVGGEVGSGAGAMHPAFRPGDWVRYYCRGRNLIEQVLEVRPTETGIDQLLLPNGQIGPEGLELDLFPATMVTPYTPTDAPDQADGS